MDLDLVIIPECSLSGVSLNSKLLVHSSSC